MSGQSVSARRGFTLAEILTVVLIVGMTAAIIIPHISTRDDLKVSSAARMLMADLLYAQNMAITQQTNHYVIFDTTNGQYTVGTLPGPVVTTHPVNQGPFIVKFGAGGQSGLTEIWLKSARFINSTNGTPYATLGFDELGTPLAYTGSGSGVAISSGAIELRCGDHRLQINIEPYTGQLSVGAVSGF